MLFSPYCREFNSLQKRYTALLHRTNTFSENKIKRSVVCRKVDGQILSGTRSEKPKILSGTRDEKRKNLFGTKLQFRKILFGSQRVKCQTIICYQCLPKLFSCQLVYALLNMMSYCLTKQIQPIQRGIVCCHFGKLICCQCLTKYRTS